MDTIASVTAAPTIAIAVTKRQPSKFELRFQSLFHSGKALIFPCDEHGSVFLDLLSERARENYLFARAVIGHEYATPVVLASE